MPEVSRLSWLPNSITGLRFVLAVVLFAGALWISFAPLNLDQIPADFGVAMMACYLLGAISDFADGWIAREFNAQSEFGARIDPMADKALTFGALSLASAASGFAPVIVAAAALIVLRDWWIDQLRNRPQIASALKVTGLAKFKTALLFVAIGLLLCGLQPWPQMLERMSNGYWTYPVGGFLMGVLLLWGSVFLSLLTGWRYIRASRLTSGGV